MAYDNGLSLARGLTLVWLVVAVGLAGCRANDCGCEKPDPEGGARVAATDCEPGIGPAGSDCASASDPGEDGSGDVDIEVPFLPLTWVAVPGGTFLMGCSPDDSACDDDEKPPHEVSVVAFEMLETEVTEAQFEHVLGWSPIGPHSKAGDVDKPLVNFTYADAVVFCEALGGRFPTEAEWEWAARSGTSTRYYCGNDAGCLDGNAWYGPNSGGVRHAVRTKAPNPFGLYDMLGNVREWCADWYDPTYYGTSPSDRPSGPGQGILKVLRGGGFFSKSDALRVSNRDADEESDDYGWEDVGFRCVRELDANAPRP